MPAANRWWIAVLHLASVVVEFRLVAGLYRWLMTHAEGFHRRGLVGTVFQFLVGHQSREAQIELASRISEVGIVGYWGTIFVWLPLGFLTLCLLVRDVTDADPGERAAVRPMLAASRRREMFPLLLPALAALLSALLHDNDAAIAELTRIGRQEHIIRETFF